MVEVIVDPNEPPLPCRITTFQFTKALTRGKKIPRVSSKPMRRNPMTSLSLGCTIRLIGLLLEIQSPFRICACWPGGHVRPLGFHRWWRRIAGTPS